MGSRSRLTTENRKLKHVVAELTLDNRALKDVLSKAFGGTLVQAYAFKYQELIKEGRPVGLDFYDLLIKKHSSTRLMRDEAIFLDSDPSC
jgi:hypothetical protein